MPEIPVFYPEDGATLHMNVVMATGKYKFPERVRGVLSAINGSTSYTGHLHVMQLKLWALSFGPVDNQTTYVLHIFDAIKPEYHTDLKLRVMATAAGPKTRIIFPGSNSVLFDRAVPVVGVTTATTITDVRITHAGQPDLVPAGGVPITPVAKSWTASFMIPSSYPCPGTSPDYTVHAEDSIGAPHCDNSDIHLDQATFCPGMMSRKSSMDGKMKSKKMSAKKKKKKAAKKK
jgi:hypothetical protein